MNQLNSNHLNELMQKATGQNDKADFIEYAKEGLTNSNYIISYHKQRYVTRIPGPMSQLLGINRRREYEILKLLKQEPFMPRTLFYDPCTGEMVTAYLEGEVLDDQSAKSPVIIEDSAAILSILHSYSIKEAFSPYEDFKERIAYVRNKDIPLPSNIDQILNYLTTFEDNRKRQSTYRTGLCHNDPFPNNFILGNTLRLIDWEYAGNGDVYFDLAAATLHLDLSEKKQFLEKYLSCSSLVPSVNLIDELTTLSKMGTIVMLWNATWALIQASASDDPQSYLGMADYMFHEAEKNLCSPGCC